MIWKLQVWLSQILISPQRLAGSINIYNIKDLKCVVVRRRRRRRRPSVPIEFPRKYISYIAAF